MQISSMIPVFKLDLGHKVNSGMVTIGKYDGTHSCLTAAAGYDKILIHSPYGSFTKTNRSSANSDVYELNLSQEITCLASGAIKPGVQRDVLLIGSPSQLLAYDVHENSDLFFKDLQDGINVLDVGNYGKKKEIVTVVGSNSSIQALRHDGSEVFWSTVGGKVLALVFFDFDRDGTNELLVGCDDSTIRVFKNEQFVAEVAETGFVNYLSPSKDTRFAYSVTNGTIGVYEDTSRLWRVKSKQNSVSLQWSGEALVCFWSNGRIDWRDPNTGQVLKRCQMRGNAAGMLLSDYRSLGVPDLICVSDVGEGYAPFEAKSQATSSIASKTKKNTTEHERQAIMELFNKKQALQVELQHYERNVAVAMENLDKGSFEKPEGALSANTRLQVLMAINEEEKCIELDIATNNNTIIRAAMVLSEGIFPEGAETLARHPRSAELRSKLRITFAPIKDVAADLHVKTLIGYPESEQFHVFELMKTLPRFSMYSLVTDGGARHPDCGYVKFTIMERLQRICLWINQNFLFENDIELESEQTKELKIPIKCLRSGDRLDLEFDADGTVKFETPDIKLAADLVHSLANYLNLNKLETTAKFPLAEAIIRNEMTRANMLSDTRLMLAATTAERAQLITALLPVAEDAAAYDLKDMISRYHEVVLLNEELIIGCHARRANHNEAVQAVQNVHQIIQQAASLRVGQPSKDVVAACRKAVQNDNIDALIKIISLGAA